MSGESLHPEGVDRLVRAVFGDRRPGDRPEDACARCGGDCPAIGGCYLCGAGPFCAVISDDGICRACGADQDGPPGLRVVRDENQ